jgi:hypothetical protein
MSVKQWINRLKNINSYLPVMQHDRQPLSEEDLIAEVMAKNIPAAWIKDFKLAELHLKTHIRDIISDLTVIQEQIKTHHKTHHDQNNQSKKQLKNPYRVHNGGHEWEDCRQNPKNIKSDGKNQNNDNNRTRRENESNNMNCKEN